MLTPLPVNHIRYHVFKALRRCSPPNQVDRTSPWMMESTFAVASIFYRAGFRITLTGKQVMLIFNRTRKNTPHIIYMSALTLMLALCMALAGCSGTTGPEGPKGAQGEQGSKGEVGPAGDDGSVMLAGKGKPDGKKGGIGDYYLNKDTGDLYGPKKGSGWGSPVGLKGAKGSKADKGDSGEDGSKIFKENGSPDSNQGNAGDYWYDIKNYTLYGPKSGTSGWGSGFNFKTKVFLYILPSHDFSSDASAIYYLSDINSNLKMLTNLYLVYLVDGSDLATADFHPIPGYGFAGFSRYNLDHHWKTNEKRVHFHINLADGNGENYDHVAIYRIPTNDIAGGGKVKKNAQSALPSNLEVNNYHEVAKYYGFE